MTYREFLQSVIDADISVSISQYAMDEVSKLDARNDQRRNTLTAEQIINNGIKKDIVSALAIRAMTASELSKAVGQSVPKIAALTRRLIIDGIVEAVDIKVKGKGIVKQYKVKGE